MSDRAEAWIDDQLADLGITGTAHQYVAAQSMRRTTTYQRLRLGDACWGFAEALLTGFDALVKYTGAVIHRRTR